MASWHTLNPMKAANIPIFYTPAKLAGGLKALLAAAPLEGIELKRSRDIGRDVAL